MTTKNSEYKSLRDISWDVPEPEYRENPALSYSTLSRYEKNGRFDSLSKLYEKLETPSLTFGQMVDTIITDGMDEFNNKFLVVDNNLDSDTAAIIKEIHNQYCEFVKEFSELPVDWVGDTAKSMGFWPADKWSNEARYKGLMKKGNIAEYWDILNASKDKYVISVDTYNKGLACVEALKTSDATKWYFGDDNNDGLERLYQLKFKTNINGVDYRVMADEIIVCHEEKWIRMIDLKSSHNLEWNFFKSFIDFNYHIQARLYAKVLSEVIKNDDYFKDFKILDYHFIVVNNNTMTPCPLVWEYNDTFKRGTLTYGKNNQIVCRDPLEIGQELNKYLTDPQTVPFDISLTQPNNITMKLKEL